MLGHRLGWVGAEVLVAVTTLGALIVLMRSSLITGQKTLIHDNVLWRYPIYQYFAESLLQENYPLWNPFSHGGEPFYPLLAQLKFFDPIVLVSLFAGSLFTQDLTILFAWDRMVQCAVGAAGTYAVFRPWTKQVFTRLTLIPILGLSSYTLGGFRVHASVDLFVWVPLTTFFLLRVLYHRDHAWHNWLMLAALVGINWQSYFFSGVWTFLLFFVTGLIVFRRDLLQWAAHDLAVHWRRAVVAAVIVMAMMAPNIVLLIEKDDYLYPARMIDLSDENLKPMGGPDQYEGKKMTGEVGQGIIMPYRFIVYTGTFSTVWDFIQAIAPDGNEHVRWAGRREWGKPSEAYIYLGFLPWAVALAGMALGRHDLKGVWGLTTVAFALLMLGPAGGVHRLLYFVFPPLWFVRHTHIFVPFFLFGMLYFYVLGLDYLIGTWTERFGQKAQQVRI